MAAVLMGLSGAVFLGCMMVASSQSYEAEVDVWPYVAADYALALVGVFGLAAIPAVSEYVMHLSPGWMRWMNNIALLGCALYAVLNFWQAEYEMITVDPAFGMPGISGNVSPVALGDELSILVDELINRSPRGWLEVAGIGLWIVSVCWLALRGGILPAGLSGTGIAAGTLSSLNAVGATFNVLPLQILGIFGLLVMLPVWFMWIGFIMLENTVAVAKPVESVPASVETRVLLRESIRRGSSRKRPLIPLWPS
jgi:hypothetical protein